MTLANLFLRYKYYSYPSLTDQPVIVCIDGWDGIAKSAAFLERIAWRYASKGYFVMGVGMRGRNGADGSRDASGLEIYDIYDALQYVRAKFPHVSRDRSAIVGWSGGGGNALAAACKFPDTWNVVVDCYGMADYGRDATNGWYQNTGGYAVSIAASIGGTPAAVPDRYYARDATLAISNYSGGKLILFHDNPDGYVPYVNTQRVIAAMDAAGLTNYVANLTTPADTPHWSHGMDGYINIESLAEDIWMPYVTTIDPWTIPTSGIRTVIDYIVTKRFSVSLNNKVGNAAATVVYDTVAGTYIITPLTSNPIVAVSIVQGELSASGNTNGETLFTVS
jgi:dienelactone hydrolase